MAFSSVKKQISIAVAGAALALGTSSAMAAALPFTVDPAGAGGAAAPFQATSLTGDSSELLHPITLADGSAGHYGKGYISYGYFLGTDNTKHYMSDYGLYVLFDLTDKTGGTDASGQTNNTLLSLTFKMYADPSADTRFTPAGSTNTSTNGLNGQTGYEYTMTDVSSDDYLIGSGELKSGVADFNSLGGAALNANTTFALTDAGKLFFTAPTPFFNMTLNGFNNQTGGAVFNADGTIAINAGGKTSFDVPEPTSIALLGLGLLGLGATTRRRSKK